MSKYYTRKTYGNDQGLSCVFRQWRADSHCNFFHGYSIGVELLFESDSLDDKNWVYDFGNLKEFKTWLQYMFDHTMIVAADDPQFDTAIELREKGLVQLRIVDAVGCEKFAEMCYNKMDDLLDKYIQYGQANKNTRLKSVTVFEHGANAATYER
jgi:6-pyruvoyltetrahydropterin/6-carboxytetrahydropterin synthase